MPKTGYFSQNNTVVFSLRIDEQIYERIREIANSEGRSINTQVMRFIKEGLDRYQKTE